MTNISIVIPVNNEEESLPSLYGELSTVLKKLKADYEIIFINDGSTDKSQEILVDLKKQDSNIKIIKFRANFGKSAALSAGFGKATKETIVMLDADLQDDPKEIPKLLNKLDEGYDLVSGWRANRSDTGVKKISSILFNGGTRLISGVQLHDFNCGLKAFTKEVASELYLHGELHRYIPVLAAKKKFRVAEVAVNHRFRKFGKSKYGFGRSWRSILDLLTIIFLTDYATKPAHFFGKIGLIFLLVGILFDGYVSMLKLATGSTQGHIPMLLSGMLFILIGLQLLSTGLIAEMIVHQQKSKH
ncbi:MAG: glycosyltransferase family 2 protein [bacterium]|nr:glycosyltransferase family 2 protein [bacterium]